MANVGDKTLIDVVGPTVDATSSTMSTGPSHVREVLEQAAKAVEKGAKNTTVKFELCDSRVVAHSLSIVGQLVEFEYNDCPSHTTPYAVVPAQENRAASESLGLSRMRQTPALATMYSAYGRGTACGSHRTHCVEHEFMYLSD